MIKVESNVINLGTETSNRMGGPDGVFSVPSSSNIDQRVDAALYSPEGVVVDSSSILVPRPLYNPEGDRHGGIVTPVKAPLAPDPGKPTLLRRPCMYLTRFIKSLPVIFISLVVGWSYYAYFVAVVLTAMEGSLIEQVVCGVIFHLVGAMFVWSYHTVVVTHPGSAPASWHLAKEDVERLASARSEDEWKRTLAGLVDQLNCQVKQRSVQGAIRYCEKCLAIKPDRSHHCSVCENCTLKMDHHCPWVNNCVGFRNYKFFILFLGYGLSYCLTIASTTARHFVKIWLLKEGELVEESDDPLGSAKYHILFVFFVSILFSLSISSLFGYHVWLLMHNRSTLEQFRAPMFDNSVSDPDGWSLGRLGNVREVFGDNFLLWALPVDTVMGDGLRFPTRISLEHTNYHSIGKGFNQSETPNRTLINPVLGSTGQVETVNTITSNEDCKVNITEVRLDTNGHAKTVML